MADDFIPGTLKSLPWIRPNQRFIFEIEESVFRLVSLYRDLASLNETDPFFVCPLKERSCESIESLHKKLSMAAGSDFEEIRKHQTRISKNVDEIYGYDSYDFAEEVLERDVMSEITYSSQKLDGMGKNLIAYGLGGAFGRWDVRFPLDPSLKSKLPYPFNPLPVCPPGMLIGPDGLPAESGRIVSDDWLRARPDAIKLPPENFVESPTISDDEYPLRILWDAILVDDPGFGIGEPHKNDIVRRVREVLDLLWKDKSHEIEQEACDILGVKSLRDYFRKSSCFFKDHLKLYSKSRRKAPIYWPLSTESGSYTLWIYYHRLTDQSLFVCVEDYLNPKIDEVTQDIERLQKDLADSGTAEMRSDLEQLQDFRQELIDMRDELLRLAKLPYKPNLNDGVMITASPLWRLFRHKPWQKSLKACWEKLKGGVYDWAHLAYSIWPDRVKEKCKTDRSIAIAHDLEHLCEVEVKKTKKKRSRKKSAG